MLASRLGLCSKFETLIGEGFGPPLFLLLEFPLRRLLPMTPQRWIKIAFLFSICLAVSSVSWAQRGTPNNVPHEIRGQVRLPSGRPAGTGILVSLEMRGGGGAAGQSQTDSQGKFEFMALEPALYEVHIRAPGYQEDYQAADLLSSPHEYLTFVLKPDTSHQQSSPAPGGSFVSALDAAAPSGARSNVESAQELMTKGNVGQSLELLKKAVGEYPKYPQAYLLMGVAYSSQQNWDDAEKSLQKAIELDQQKAPAYVALGSVENEKKKYPEAEKYLLKAAELSPDAPDVHSELARTYFALGRWQEADAQMSKAITLRPDDAGQHILMGNIQLRERNAEGALKEFQEALRIDPKGPLAEPTRQMVARIESALKQAQTQKK